MGKKIFVSILGLVLGIGLAYVVILHPSFSFTPGKTVLFDKPQQAVHKKEVIGFLPYWLVSKAKLDYSSYITNLTYFALTVDTDGSILKLNSPIEAEPGWYALNSGKVDKFLGEAKKKNLDLSLTVFSGDGEVIDQVVSNPVVNATNLANDIIPVMEEHGFKELNLDLEKTREASIDATQNFTLFTKTLKDKLNDSGFSLTVDITGMDLIKHDLIDPEEIGKIADHILVMTYDFHFAGSMVTGAVAPLDGAGVTAEYDVRSAIEKAKAIIPSQKILLGVPLYGYEWETITNIPHAGVIPGSGITASTMRVNDLISSCSTCSALFDEISMESYLIYRDDNTSSYHQLFYPTSKSTQAKVDFIKEQDLGGVGLWALGYEDATILEPLKDYVRVGGF